METFGKHCWCLEHILGMDHPGVPKGRLRGSRDLVSVVDLMLYRMS